MKTLEEQLKDNVLLYKYISQNYISKAEVLEIIEGMKKEITHPQLALYEKGYNQALNDITEKL